MKLRVGALALLVPLVATLLAGCTPTVALTPAADATNPKCADVIVRLPSSVASEPVQLERQTNAQATGAWGDPTAVVLTCGVKPPGPTANLCYTVTGIDWIETHKGATYTYTTFGRVPAVRVVIDSTATHGQGTIILDELSDAVGQIRQSSKTTCTDVLQSTGLPTATPTPGPLTSQ